MRWMVAAALLVAGTELITLAQTPSGEPPPIGGSGADAISIDVSVASDGQAVAGLTVSDFELLDNGVVQRVSRVEPAAMPLDVTILVDVSSHTAAAAAVEVPAAETARMVKDDVAAIAAMLRPQDRLRLLAADTYVKEIFGTRPPTTAPAIGPMPMHGLPSVYDALVTAMLRPPESGRRQLVVAWVKALDFVSVVDAEAVRDVARRTDAVVHIVQRGLIVNPNVIQNRALVVRAWRPHLAADVSVLTDVAALTGGTFHGVGMQTDGGIAGVFKEIFDGFHDGYVLHYAPEAVKREGWHDIAVRVPARRDVVVRTRSGYAAEVPPSAARDVGTGSSAALPRTGVPALDLLAETFVRSDAVAFDAAVRNIPDAGRTLRDYVDHAPLWPAHPNLEAAFVLGLVKEPLLGFNNRVRNDALAVLRHQHVLVRDPLGADAFECAWYRAEMALLQATYGLVDALAAIKHSLTRCADDARLRLGLAVTTDRDAATSRGTGATMPAEVDVLALFDAAMAFPETAAEASVRSAFVAYRMGDLDEAARRVALANAHGADGFVRYLGHVALGRVLQKQGQIDRAVEQFRAALVASPGAQRARLGLMSALMIQGARTEAEALAEAVQTAPDDQFDPFSVYWLGDFRSMREIEGALRELAQ